MGKVHVEYLFKMILKKNDSKLSEEEAMCEWIFNLLSTVNEYLILDTSYQWIKCFKTREMIDNKTHTKYHEESINL